VVTTPVIDNLLAEIETSSLSKDHGKPEAVNIRETRRAYDRAVKLPGSLC